MQLSSSSIRRARHRYAISVAYRLLALLVLAYFPQQELNWMMGLKLLCALCLVPPGAGETEMRFMYPFITCALVSSHIVAAWDYALRMEDGHVDLTLMATYTIPFAICSLIVALTTCHELADLGPLGRLFMRIRGRNSCEMTCDNKGQCEPWQATDLLQEKTEKFAV
ncbi:hypothetical protein MIND_00139000 [Mycena indigotica]|uniref:Uncharacterized protein n=1 Tax=Mycena indigotica TaxID=2126181 RepID=A0A8H6TF38_9AGAR|nr:uncharacterized protein MIND_00139000 [Mycena indigotica]KAF7316206.1 hypothetical protein MIND_00139000 [Mycena indigotica]